MEPSTKEVEERSTYRRAVEGFIHYTIVWRWGSSNNGRGQASMDSKQADRRFCFLFVEGGQRISE